VLSPARATAIGRTTETADALLGQAALKVPGHDTTRIEEWHLIQGN
jgi:phosphoheptose isomerase